jgi:hypothetical protein
VTDCERESRAQVGLEGNGAPLVRERAVAAAVQRTLERLYQLERRADVDAFVTPAEEGEREVLFVREVDGDLELLLRLPALARAEFDAARDADLDPLCQIIEGVSHFVYLADRAHAAREATQLEMELQAEVDKYVVLAGAMAVSDARASERLRSRLYEDVHFAHDEGSELGERYRIANRVAARFIRRLEREYLSARRFRDMHTELRSFYRLGQEGKLRHAA